LRLTDEISLNIGEGETLVGIEVLDAKEVLGHGNLPTVVLENVPSVEASVNDPTNGHVGRDQVAHIGLRFDSSGIRQQRVSGRLTGASNSPSDTNGQLLGM
jgi:hypothetical protein